MGHGAAVTRDPCPICGGNCSLTLPPLPLDYPFLPAEEIAAMQPTEVAETAGPAPGERRMRTLAENRQKRHGENR